MAIQDDYSNFIKYINNEEINTPAREIFKNLKEHIFSNPEDKISVDIKELLYRRMKYCFTNPKLDNAFKTKDDYKYTRIVEIFKELPYMVHFNEYIGYFWNLIFHDSEYYGTVLNYYKGCKWFCNELHPGEIPNELFDRVIKYAEKNNTIMTSGWNYYKSWNDEYSDLKLLSVGLITKELNDRKPVIEDALSRQGKPSDDYAIKEYLLSEKKGIVGEYFIFEKLKKYKGKTTFVAKEYGNGFGYDILYEDAVMDKEWLVEVKATTNTITTDTYFTLTDNEKKVLEDTLTLENTGYVVERVFIDLDRNQCMNVPLYYDKDNHCFYNNDYYGKRFIYNVDENDPLRFNKSKELKKVLETKNNNQ